VVCRGHRKKEAAVGTEGGGSDAATGGDGAAGDSHAPGI
jgi:hypothetical protein